MGDKIAKVSLNGQTLIDISEDSVTPEVLARDETAHDAAGESIRGTAEFGGDTSDCYKTTDPASTDLDDADYIPFNDVSDAEVPKKKTLFSTIVNKLKDTFLTKLNFKPEGIGSGYCEGTISGSSITATIDNFVLTNGGIVVIKLTGGMPSNATLNISNTGAKDIRWYPNRNLNTIDTPLMVAGVWTLMYNGTFWNIISFNISPVGHPQNYVADTSGNLVISFGIDQNAFQFKNRIAFNDLAWNRYINGAWVGDRKIIDQDNLYDVLNQSVAHTGKNLLCQKTPDIGQIDNGGTTTINGITYTFNSDGSITANGTATADSSLYLATHQYGYMLPKGNYVLSGCPSGGGTDKYFIRLQIKPDDESETSYIDTGSGILFTLNSDARNSSTSNYYIQIRSGQTVSNLVFKPMVRHAYTDATYEKYIPNGQDVKGVVYVGTCTTAADQQNKVATVDSDFRLKKGVRIAIKFSNTNTFSSSTNNPVTLNVNGTGAKNIYYGTTHSGAGNTGAYTRIYGVANRYIYYVYDGNYWVWDGCTVDDNSTNFLRNDASSTLTASGGPYLNVKSSTIDMTQANNGVESSQYPAYIIQDKNGRDISRLESVVEVNGQTRTFLQVCNYNTSTASHFRAGLTIFANKLQDVWYSLSNPHYFARALGHGYGTCSTAADQRIKEVTCPRFVLTNGAVIHVKFTNTNTYNSTTENPVQLNVNGTGAKNIWYNAAHSGSGNTGTNTRIYGEANRTFTYMYDGTYWVWLGCGYEADSTSYLPLSGGTMNNNAVQAFIRTDIDLKQSNNGLSSDVAYYPLRIKDKNNQDWVLINGVAYTNGNTKASLLLRNYNSSGEIVATKGIHLIMSKSGSLWYSIDNRETFNANLGNGYGECTTAAATAAKTVAINNYVASYGFVVIKFVYDVPANATLNINSNGAKSIYYRGAAITAGKIKAGDRATFVYNGTQYELIGIDSAVPDLNSIITISDCDWGTTLKSKCTLATSGGLWSARMINNNFLYVSIETSYTNAVAATIPAYGSTTTDVFFRIKNKFKDSLNYSEVMVDLSGVIYPAFANIHTVDNISCLTVSLRKAATLVAGNGNIRFTFVLPCQKK